MVCHANKSGLPDFVITHQVSYDNPLSLPPSDYKTINEGRWWIELDVWCIRMDFIMRSLSFINSTRIYIIFKLIQIRSNNMTRVGVSHFFIFCRRELGIGIVAYSPLGHGFFAGYTPKDSTVHDGRQVTLKTPASVSLMCASN